MNYFYLTFFLYGKRKLMKFCFIFQVNDIAICPKIQNKSPKKTHADMLFSVIFLSNLKAVSGYIDKCITDMQNRQFPRSAKRVIISKIM